MTHNTIRDALRRMPFVPFEVTMSNGEAYTVSYPENGMLTNVNLYICDPQSNQVVTCALLHVASLQHLEPSDAAGA